MDYQALNTELVTDPLARGYSGMSDEEAAADLNTVYRTITKDTLTSAEIYEQTDRTEFDSKTDAQKTDIRDIWGLAGDIQITVGSKARTVYASVFGASTTATNLQAATQVAVSRAVELQLGFVSPGDVTAARAYGSV